MCFFYSGRSNMTTFDRYPRLHGIKINSTYSMPFADVLFQKVAGTSAEVVETSRMLWMAAKIRYVNETQTGKDLELLNF